MKMSLWRRRNTKVRRNMSLRKFIFLGRKIYLVPLFFFFFVQKGGCSFSSGYGKNAVLEREIHVWSGLCVNVGWLVWLIFRVKVG